MAHDITIICSDPKMMKSLKSMISIFGLAVKSRTNLEIMIANPSHETTPIFLLYLDGARLDSDILRKFRKQFHKANIIGLSSQNYHPDLKEAIRQGVFTALIRPPFDEELIDWISCLLNNVDSSRAPGAGKDTNHPRATVSESSEDQTCKPRSWE